MAPVASQLIEEVTAHAQSGCLEDAREICADGTYFPNNLRITEIVILLAIITYVIFQASGLRFSAMLRGVGW